ncbi:MAG: hypothetical protein V4603_15600 [Pseudomonadota bacterium]
MSLVNDMLRDLDRRNRRGGEQTAPADVSMRVVSSAAGSNRLPAIAIVLSVVVGVTSVYFLFNHSHETVVATTAPAATVSRANGAAASVSTQPESSSATLPAVDAN